VAAGSVVPQMGMVAELAGCKELRQAKEVHCFNKGLSSAELATLGTLGSVLPSLEKLCLYQPAAGPDGVQRLAERLGAGALPAVTLVFWISATCTWATQAPRRSPPPWAEAPCAAAAQGPPAEQCRHR
jgi:hypothetical protein